MANLAAIGAVGDGHKGTGISAVLVPSRQVARDDWFTGVAGARNGVSKTCVTKQEFRNEIVGGRSRLRPLFVRLLFRLRRRVHGDLDHGWPDGESLPFFE